MRSVLCSAMCLKNAGVFKQDAAGQAAFLKFMESVGYRKA